MESASFNEQELLDVLVDFLVEGRDARRVLDFRLPDSKQQRLESLLQLSREETLTLEQASELETVRKLEHVVRLMKARVAGRTAR